MGGMVELHTELVIDCTEVKRGYKEVGHELDE